MRSFVHIVSPSDVPGSEIRKTVRCHWAFLCAKHCAQTLTQVIRS